MNASTIVPKYLLNLFPFSDTFSLLSVEDSDYGTVTVKTMTVRLANVRIVSLRTVAVRRTASIVNVRIETEYSECENGD